MAITVNARITGYQTAAQTKEVDVAAGWNLVSFPKVTIKSTALGDLQPAIYQFKDAKWERFTAQQFEPNTAYFMDFIQSGKIKILIDTSQPNVQLKQGWNAIGVPIDVKIKEGKIKSTGQEYALKNKVTALYVFNAEQQKWSSTINDDVSLVPGKGYLVYAQEAGELSYTPDAAAVEIAQLIAKLKSNDKQVKLRAIEILGTKGTAAKDAIPALVILLSNANGELRLRVAEALSKIGDEESVAKAISNMGLAAKEIIPALINALKDSNKVVRAYAAIALGEIGPAAKDAVKELTRLKTTDPDSTVKQITSLVLQKIQK